MCADTPLRLRSIIKSNSCESWILNDSSFTAFIHSSTCSRSPFVGCRLFFVEIIEIVEHKIHIFLLFTLKVMNNSMVFMNFDSYMGVCLPRYSSRLNELALLMVIQIVVSLSSWYIHHFIVHQAFIVIQLLRSPTNWLIVKVPAIFM